MILAWLTARTLGQARWLWLVGAVVALIAGFLIWDHFDDKAAVESDRAIAEAKAQKIAREADRAAQGKMDDIQTDTEKRNDEARAAASGTDDPLRSALGKLRDR